MTDSEAIQALLNLNPKRSFSINFRTAHIMKGMIYDIDYPESWDLSMQGQVLEREWDYSGKTLGEAVERAMEHEQPVAKGEKP